ncbi:MAG: TRAP transporter small permease [Rhodobacter sp.]|nr:TRAP transporter small permease [Rhodobacter sp.]
MDPAPKRPWLPEDVIAALALLVIVAITFANVIVRYFTDFSFAWTEDFSIVAMVLMVFAGAASATLGDRHIRIEILYAKGHRGLRMLSRLALAVAFGTLAVLLGKIAYDEWRWGELFSILDLPRWWTTAPLVVLSGLLSLRALGFPWQRAQR